jgi:hypothetical protein
MLRRLRSAAAAVAAVFVPALLAGQEPTRPVSPADAARPVSPADAPRRVAAADTLPDLLVEVDIDRGATQSLLGLQQDTAVFLPMAAFLELAEVRVVEVAPGRRFMARSPDGRPLTVSTADQRASRGDVALPWDPAAALWRGDVLFVRLDLLSALLGVRCEMIWNDLVVRVTDADSLPVVRRMVRERRRAALMRETEPRQPPALLHAAAPVVDGLAVDWAVTAATRSPQDNHGLALGIGATVLGGGLDVQTFTATIPSGTSTTTAWQWTRAWTDRAWLRQVRIGDIATGGERPFGVRGAEVSNRPFLRDAAFAVQDLTGHLPSGWEVEVFRGADLLGYQPVDRSGGYAVGVPVVYGPNPLETVAYGPNGEVRRSERTFVISFDRLPAGRFEYSVSGGECQGSRCDAASNVDLRYGATRRLTLQAGADRFWRSGTVVVPSDTAPGVQDTVERPDLFHPYARAVLSVNRPVALTAEAVADAFFRTRVDVDPSPDLHVDASVLRFDTTVIEPIVGSPTYAWQVDGNVFWRPGILGPDFYVQAAGAWQESANRHGRQVRVLATGRTAGVRLSGALQRIETRQAGLPLSRTTSADAGADGVVTRGRLRNTLLGTGFGASCADAGAGCRWQLASWRAALGRQLHRLLRLDLGIRRERGTPGVGMNVSLQLATSWLRATSRNTIEWRQEVDSATSDTSVAPTVNGIQVFEGSLLWDRRTGRLGAASGRNLGRAGVAGEVFLDHNGNGRRDGGETVLPGVLLRVGADAVITDSLGRFSAWDLVPFSDAVIEVDTLALENPLWVPAAAISRVVPAPNSYRFVGIPIRQGGEIAGRVELDGEPLPGAMLTLREEATGRYVRIPSFTDATFYAMRLAPGRYTLAPAEGVLEQLRARAEVLQFEIGGAGLLRYDDLVVRLVRE